VASYKIATLAVVPEGQPKIARHFSAGNQTKEISPEVTAEINPANIAHRYGMNFILR
jgi:hypothetical protein